MARGAGKFKAKRGGGRSFSRNMAIDRDASAFPDGEDPRAHRDKEEDDSEEEEDEEEGSEEEEESEEEESGEEQPELTRAQRREMKKKQVQAKQAAKQPQQDGIDEDDEDADLINPNHVQKKLTISDLNEPRQLSRREREQKEKKEAEERYWKLHLQGKTDKAKADLQRLAKIRAEREAAAAKRQAENEAKAKEIQAKKEAQLNKRKV